MANPLALPRTGHSHDGARPAFTAVALIALAFILTIGTGIWQVQRHTDARAAAGRAISGGTAGTLARSLPGEDAAGGLSGDSEDTWQSFRRAIQQPAQRPQANDLPAYALLLGITSEEQADGASVVKRLVLDLGDLSVHSVDLAAP